MKTIFVSSTFRDMDLERDTIQELVYPRINALARQHGQSVSFCDLRWGIDTSALESEAGSRKVLDVCLDEIDRCQPPMVVILGYRYGWIPSPRLVQSTAERFTMQLDDLEKSVTALEIEYGALSDPTRLQNTLFYFREIEGDAPADYQPEDAAHAARLAALKARIHALTGGRVRSYTLRWQDGAFAGIEAFVDLLTADLTSLLQPQWQAHNSRSPLEKEFYTHAVYLQEKAGAFRARQALADRVLADIAAGKLLTVLKGPVGSGKSTLFSYIASRLQADGWQVEALFSNLTPQTNTAMDVLRLFVRRLEQLLGQPAFDGTADGRSSAVDDLTQLQSTLQANAGQEMLRGWQNRLEELCALYAKTDKKLVLMLDAADQLFADALRDKLVFIPRSLSERVRFVLTALPELGTGAAEITEIEPVDDDDKRRVIDGILHAHNRELSPRVVDAMLQAAAADTPLYLSFLVQRLLMMNKQDFESIRSSGDGMAAITRQQLAVLGQCPATLQDMSSDLMDTAAQRVGGTMVRQALRLLAAAPGGLRVSDLENLLKGSFNRLDFAHFISYMNDCFVVRSDGRYDFSHKSIRQGLLQRESEARQLHKALLAHFGTLDTDDEVRVQEICYHCILADDKAAFADYLLQTWNDGDWLEIPWESAAKNACRLARQDEGAWLQALLGASRGPETDRVLLKFISAPYADVADQQAEDIVCLLAVARCGLALAEQHYKDDPCAVHGHMVLDMVSLAAFCEERIGGDDALERAIKHRNRQVTVAGDMRKADPDSLRVKKRYAFAMRRLAECAERRGLWEPALVRACVKLATEAFTAVYKHSNTEKNCILLAEQYLSAAENYYGWVEPNYQYAEQYIEATQKFFQKQYDATQKTLFLEKLAAVEQHWGKLYIARHMNEQALQHFEKRLQLLQQLADTTGDISHQALLAEACHQLRCEHLSLPEELEPQWLQRRKQLGQRAVALGEGVVRARGSIQDLRCLAAMYEYEVMYGNPDDSAASIALWHKVAALRLRLYENMGSDNEKVELGRAYMRLAGALQEKGDAASLQQAERYNAKLDALNVREDLCAYSQVLEVLRHMEAKYVNLIPEETILFFYDHADYECDFRMTESLDKTELSPKAKDILAMISTRYWSDLKQE